MWNKFKLWIHQFNLIALWGEERRLDRVAQVEIVSELCSAIRSQSDIAIKSLSMCERFLRNFETQDAPDAWVVRDEDEVKSAMDRYNLTQDKIDELDFDPFRN